MLEPKADVINQTISHYRIIEKLGGGGMGIVFRAEDRRLNRSVAIKFLPPDYFGDVVAERRFEREAKAAASLNHPHICMVHDVGEHEGQPYLVMEYLEGQTLKQLLKEGPLSEARALELACQIADALEAAHSKKIIHRDIKPANVFVTSEGRAKVLDFGLARTLASGSLGEQELTASLTQHGSAPGTLPYMSPEQIRAEPVDQRTDLFSFGIVLYEMLSGKHPFLGNTSVETASAILLEEPDRSQFQGDVRDLLLRLLAKQPEQRYRTAREVRQTLEQLALDRSVSRHGWASTVLTRAVARAVANYKADALNWNRRLAWAVAFLMACVSGFLLVLVLKPVGSDLKLVRFAIGAPDGMTFNIRGQDAGPVSVSPDGRHLSFVVTSVGKNMVGVQDLDELEARLLEGTDGASLPFWSPDSRSIGFFSNGQLKRVDVNSGVVQSICSAPLGMGASWNKEGLIVFAPGFFSPLHAVPAAGGQAEAILDLDAVRGDISHRWPFFLPDGEHYLLRVVSSNAENSGLYLGSITSRELSLLLKSDSNAIFAPPGYLLYLSRGTLMSRRFDPRDFKMDAQAAPVLDHVAFDAGFSRGAFSASEDGVLAYSQTSRKRRQLSWYDRSGQRLGTLAPPDFFENFEISPDGKKIVLDRRDSNATTSDLWLHDLVLGNIRRLTFDSGVDSFPVWSPDGSSVFFSNDRRGSLDIFQKPLAAGGEERLILGLESEIRPMSCSPDARFLLYEQTSTANRSDLWVKPLIGDQPAFPFVQTEAGEFPGKFHPSGRWIAYCSDESFRYEVFVQPFPPKGSTRWQISRDGGYQPKWSTDGRELFYLTGDMTLMSTVIGEGPEFEFGSVNALFTLKPDDLNEVQHYAPAPDGRRILVNELVEDSEAVEITVVIDWQALLEP